MRVNLLRTIAQNNIFKTSVPNTLCQLHLSPLQSNRERLKEITFNVEEIKSNYYYTLLKSLDTILCTHNSIYSQFCVLKNIGYGNMKKGKFDEWFQNFNNYRYIRYHDTFEPIVNFQAPWAQSGIAFLWPQNWKIIRRQRKSYGHLYSDHRQTNMYY